MNRRREKLINAVLFFVKNTEMCGRTKLVKLLNDFEFEHFRQTGNPPIGLTYYAWDFGPLPKDFWVELTEESFASDLDSLISVQKVTYPNGKPGYRFQLREGTEINESVFSPREVRILKQLANTYRTATASELTEMSHEPGTPWDRTVKEKGERETIDYLLALDNESLIDPKFAREKLDDFIAVGKYFDIEAVK